jgi:hypothetical protein
MESARAISENLNPSEFPELQQFFENLWAIESKKI